MSLSVIMLYYIILFLLFCVDALLDTHGYEESDGLMLWELKPYAEFESGKAEGWVSVQGRLRSHSQFWLYNLDPSSFVRKIVTQGYRIPFIRFPDPIFYKNHRSAHEHAEFVEEVIEELVAQSCVAVSSMSYSLQSPECGS